MWYGLAFWRDFGVRVFVCGSVNIRLCVLFKVCCAMLYELLSRVCSYLHLCLRCFNVFVHAVVIYCVVLYGCLLCVCACVCVCVTVVSVCVVCLIRLCDVECFFLFFVCVCGWLCLCVLCLMRLCFVPNLRCDVVWFACVVFSCVRVCLCVALLTYVCVCCS